MWHQLKPSTSWIWLWLYKAITASLIFVLICSNYESYILISHPQVIHIRFTIQYRLVCLLECLYLSIPLRGSIWYAIWWADLITMFYQIYDHPMMLSLVLYVTNNSHVKKKHFCWLFLGKSYLQMRLIFPLFSYYVLGIILNYQYFLS